jgi:hypothetical protein
MEEGTRGLVSARVGRMRAREGRRVDKRIEGIMVVLGGWKGGRRRC